MLFSWKLCILIILHPCNCLNLLDLTIWKKLENSIKHQHRTIDLVYSALFNADTVKSTLRICMRTVNKSHVFTDSLDEILSRNHKIPVDLYSGDNLYYQLRQRLYFVDSIEALRTLVEDERPIYGTVPRYNFYTIVLPSKIKHPLRIVWQMLKFCWEIQIVNVNVVVEDENNVVTFYTYFPYTPNSCNNIVPNVQARFVGHETWGSKVKPFTLKIKNFFKCPIKVLTWENPPFIMLNHSRKGSIEPISGLDGQILNLFGRIFNATVEIVPQPVGKETEEILTLLQHNKADLAIGNLRCSYKNLKFVSLTDAYYMSSIRIVLKTTDVYSSLEVLFFPFDLYTWLVITTFFMGQRLCRMVSKKDLSKRLYQKSYNHRMNMIWYLFTCLMVRSAYESSVFKYLHKKPIKALPTNLDDAVDQGYRFLVDFETYSNMVVPAKLNDSLIVLNVAESQILSQMQWFSGKIGVFFLEDYVTNYRSKVAKYVRLRQFGLIKENIFSKMACIYLPKFSFLYLQTNSYLQRLGSTGLFQKYYQDFINVKALRNTEKMLNRMIRQKPNKLGTQDLMGAFQMFFLLKGLCVVVFLLEIAAQRYQRLRAAMEFFH